MKKTKWMELEITMENDCFSIFYELEMRKALLESGKFPKLKEHLEKEIAEFQKRFDELFEMFKMAETLAKADREKQRAAKAAKTPKNGA
jgi:predicted nuclease with TOPRIM domain